MFNQLNDIQKNKIFNSILTLVILLTVFLGVKTISSLKEYSYIGRGTYAANVININGTGEVFAIPDTASFSFSVIEEGKTVKIAQDKASVKVNTVIDAVKSMGVAEKDIKTESYNSYPKYDYDYRSTSPSICANGYCPPPAKQVLTGYEVSQTISVKVRKKADAGTILTKVGTLGATNISGLDFIIDDMDKVQAEARDKAIADAKAKAEILSKSLGIRLDKIVNFYENGSQPPVYFGLEKGMSADSAPATVPQTPAGENKVTSNVTITYEIK